MKIFIFNDCYPLPNKYLYMICAFASSNYLPTYLIDREIYSLLSTPLLLNSSPVFIGERHA